MFAGHCPTANFSHKEWSRMEVRDCKDQSYWGSGWKRTTDDRGKPICVFIPSCAWQKGFSVRPIVRVKMGRREVTDSQQTIYQWLCDRNRRAGDKIAWKY